jgi:hypothetical protein
MDNMVCGIQPQAHVLIIISHVFLSLLHLQLHIHLEKEWDVWHVLVLAVAMEALSRSHSLMQRFSGIITLCFPERLKIAYEGGLNGVKSYRFRQSQRYCISRPVSLAYSSS